jgi:flavodoxin
MKYVACIGSVLHIKKWYRYLFVLLTLFAYPAVAISVQDAIKGKRILIVYYSRTNTTKQLALAIQRQTGGDISEIVPEHPYPDSYAATVALAKAQISAGTTIPVKDTLAVKNYDVIFVGYPIWWNTIAVPVRSFLMKNAFEGKVVIPFATYKMSGFGYSLADLAKMTPGATHLPGLAVDADNIQSSPQQVNTWLKTE